MERGPLACPDEPQHTGETLPTGEVGNCASLTPPSMEPGNKVLTITEIVEQANEQQRQHDAARAAETARKLAEENEVLLTAFQENYPEVVATCQASKVELSAGKNQHSNGAIFFALNGFKISAQYSPPTTVWLDSSGWSPDLLSFARFLHKKLIERAS